MSVSAHPHFSFKKGAIIACPLRSRKNLVAIPLGAPRSRDLMLGLEAAIGSLKDLQITFLSSISLRHRWVARSVALLFRKATLYLRAVLLRRASVAASFAL